VDVLTPAGVNPAKLDRIRSLGATVIEIPGGVAEAKAAARVRVAGLSGAVLIEDGRHPEIAEGAGTIAVELLGSHRPDTVVVPVGDGALITGIARWVKEFTPSTRVIGVCASGAPSMLHSLRAGHPVPTERADTIAEGIMISTPVAESVARMCALVDDIVLVDDDALISAMRLALRTLGLVLEPAGAAGLAAIAVHDLPGSLVATVLTGGNARLETLTNQGDPR
jgi:threonine dehydratase